MSVNIKLKDQLDNEVILSGVNSLTAPLADGSGTVQFTLGGSGASSIYKFYDSSDNELIEHTVDGLATAATYTKNGGSKLPVGGTIFFIDGSPEEGTADKFYVYNEDAVLIGATEELPPADLNQYYKMWTYVVEDGTEITPVYEDIPECQIDGIGRGKIATNAVLAKDNGAYIKSAIHSSVLGPSIELDTLWYWLQHDINGNSIGGCNDWYIPSMTEMTILKDIKPDWFYGYSWQSEEDATSFAPFTATTVRTLEGVEPSYVWSWTNGYVNYGLAMFVYHAIKDAPGSAVAIRSF